MDKVRKNKFSTAAYYFLLSVSATVLFSFALYNGNDLTNGGFENGDFRWNKWWGLELDNVNKHTGEVSCKIQAKPDEWRGASQVIECPRSAKKIIVSGWMKTHEIFPIGKPWNNARIGVRFMKTRDEEDMENYVGKKYPPVVGEAHATSGWKKYKRKYKIPKGCNFIEINLMCGNATGTAWFDDIHAELK
ncbi:MAG: hypothetical protein CMP67_01060 [Flavobacteriales bacterium]|nr:hypothetical protein [Flavobacteriales bacterium]|tara:strand:+ start:194 stop:763 length:570 start_codon:yes stop_codon:yes gene_type:complete